MTEAEVRLKCIGIAARIERDSNRGGGLPLANAIADWVCKDTEGSDLRLQCCEAVIQNGATPKGIANYLQSANDYYRFSIKDFPVPVAEKPQETQAPASPGKPSPKKKRTGRRIAPFSESS
jgi:hypothetical protein